MLKKMNNMNIKGRLNYVFRLIIIAFSVVAVVISAMMIYMSMDYRRVLKRYAFPQGDIATAMSEAAEIRGASRGVVGYDSVSLISSMKEQHDEHVEAFEAKLEQIRPIMSSKAGKECMDKIDKAWAENKEIDEKEKNCMAVTAAADYLVTFREGYYYKDAFLKRTQPFSMQEKISIIKKTKRSEKEVDIAPMILDIREYESEPLLPGLPLKQEGIFMKLVTGSAENLKPQLVMEAFCKYLGYDYDPMGFQYHRLETYLKKDGELQPLGSVGWEITEEKHPDEEQKN